MKPLHRLPLDAWFDDVPHPYDTWPMATNNTHENPRPEEETIQGDPTRQRPNQGGCHIKQILIKVRQNEGHHHYHKARKPESRRFPDFH